MKHYLLLLLALAIISCAPPYSAELNSSAGLARQMTLLGTMGPVSSPDGSSDTAIKFLPIKPTAGTIDAVSVQSGFLVSESPGQESLNFAFQGSGGNVQTINAGGPFSLAGADSSYPLYEYDVIATTNTANILVFRLDETSAASVQLFTAGLAGGPFQSAPLSPNPEALINIFSPAAALMLGAQVFPVSSSSDNFNFFYSQGPGLSDSNGTALLGVTGPVFTSATPGTPLSLPGAGNRVLYYLMGPLGASSYASYFTGGQWVCYQWTTAASLTQLPGVTRRIDALLTNGNLISTQDGTLTVYGPNGSKLSSVPLGGMQFCYEAYVGTTPYVFFSLSMGFPHQSWAFRVYAIPTSALTGLKG